MKHYLFFFFVLFISSMSYAQNKKTIIVETPDQFVDAIGSNRTIQLKTSEISLKDVSYGKNGSNYRFDEEHDGYELVIFGVKNLNIIGLGSAQVKITTEPQYGDVIVFENCEQITIENINAGHGPEKGYCTGGVFNFLRCKNITINQSTLYGSGMEGITAEGVRNLICNNTTITGCTYSIMTLNNSTGFQFNSCEFTENQEFDLINIANCNGIKFTSCIISDNITSTDDVSKYSLFNVNRSKDVILKDCKVEGNKMAYFCNVEDAVQLLNTSIENNSFEKREFK
jgi:hypothetical protein